MTVEVPKASLNNPFLEQQEMEFTVPGQASYQPGLYEEKLKQGFELMQRPFKAAGETNTQKQHLKTKFKKEIKALPQKNKKTPSNLFNVEIKLDEFDQYRTYT